ncbi:MAG: hypothetical protein JWL84_5142 [Rhodospirillales bacterium]|nr:hypothetical protein [Rhodospirillales bacterium]
MSWSATRSVRSFALAGAFMAGVASQAPPAFADPIPPGWQANAMRPIGYSEVGGRGGAFKMAIRQVGGRWYLYVAHLWHHGWSILDVTDAANPEFVKFIPGPDNTWTIQMTLHDDLMITALQQSAPGWGNDPTKPFDEGVLIWNIADPVNPKQLAHWRTGATGTHRNSYPGGKYAYLSAGISGYRGNILLILDVSDPANPKEAGRFAMPGQKLDEPKPDGPFGFHGPANISADGKTASMGFAPGVINLDISDVAHPKLIGRLDFSPPFISAGSQSIHSVLPIPDKNLLYVNSEASAEDCDTDALNFAGLIDNKNPAKPRLISLFPVPVPPAEAPYQDFCDKGGRFGPHNINQEQHLPDVEKQGDLVYLTYFNAGLRVFDIKDPHLPVETGWFIPPQPTKRIGPQPTTKLVTQTEDVLVDTRGNIFVDDKQWGIFVLRYSGPDQPAPTSK